MKLSIVCSLLFFFLITVRLLAQQTPADTLKANQNPIQKTIADTLALPVNGKSTLDQLEIDKLIVNETISKAGNEFLELFFAQWNWPITSNESFIIVIAERPFRGISTQIVISVNDMVVFDSFLQSRYDFLEYLAEAAFEQTAGYLINYANIIKELEGEDTMGTGIY